MINSQLPTTNGLCQLQIRNFLLTVTVILFSIGFETVSFGQNRLKEKETPRTVKRVKRPNVEDSDSKGIYFDNIFRDGFVGDPPNASELANKTKGGINNSTDGNTGSASGANWSRLITRESIEDEVKLIQRKLQPITRSPSGFNSKLADARQQFSMLSTLFGIVHEYDKDVRWKKYAVAAQQGFAEVAEKSRTASRPTFELARRRTEDLAELIRGGTIEIPENAAGKIKWPKVASRRALMVQLEQQLQAVLKPSISSEQEFKDRRDDTLRQANIVAAIANVLVQNGMDEADDDGYVAFAKVMESAATDLTDAINNNEFEPASAAVNRIEQSCTDCHAEWR